MGELANQVQHEFWRPPVQSAVSEPAVTEFIETCRRCGTEFIVGSRFCHACGVTRPEQYAASRILELPGLVELSFLGERLGLNVASLIAFIAGTVCIIGALAMGVVFSARTVLDWQAIQIWRVEWLLGAIAAFGAARLLKKSS